LLLFPENSVFGHISISIPKQSSISFIYMQKLWYIESAFHITPIMGNNLPFGSTGGSNEKQKIKTYYTTCRVQGGKCT